MGNKKLLNTLLVAILVMNTALCSAQNRYLTAGTYYYAEVGDVIGNQTCIKAALNLIVYQKYVLTGGYYMCSRNTPYLPDGISAPLSIGFPSSAYPQQTSNMFGLMIGKAILARNWKTRLLLRGGICFGTVATPQYFSTYSGSAYPYQAETNGTQKNFTNNQINYTYSIVSNGASGLLFNPTYEFPFSEYIGVSTGIFCMATRNSSALGIDLNLMLGKCRHKISDGN